MEKRKLMVMDVETAGGFGNPLVYDFGYKIVDRDGNVYADGSYMVNDIIRNWKLMNTAYYADKIPNYWKDYQDGKREMISVEGLAELIDSLIYDYSVEAVCAYNAKFDINALVNTFNYFGFSFNPFGSVKIYDIWGMACETLGLQKKFFKDVDEQNWKSDCGNPRTSAEIMWRYISRLLDFEEEHTGREDTEIEVEIMIRCFKTHKKMTKFIIHNPWKIVADEYKMYRGE